MAVNINVPSQVKTYANLAAFPATGALKTIYIAEDTNKTYRWTGSVYVEVSGADFSGYVPTSRTLTINGTTQDLSADRTFTISTGITIGTTAIASGTVGRVLFEGAGNVVQESANLFWDNTNGRLGIGTSSPTAPLQITTSGLITALYINTGNDGGFTAQNNGTLAVNRTTQVRLVNGSTIFGSNDRTYQLVNIGKGTTDADFYVQYWNGASYLERFRVFSTGNVSIGTTTDAGFKLDVNGTLRSLGFNLLTSTGNHYANGFQTSSTDGTFNFRRFSDNGWVRFALGASSSFQMSGNTSTGEGQLFASGGGYYWTIYSNGSERMRINTSGNVLIGTTTDIASSLLTLQSTTKGFLPPRMTTTQRTAIASPAAGLMVYDTTLNVISYYNGTMWI